MPLHQGDGVVEVQRQSCRQKKKRKEKSALYWMEHLIKPLKNSKEAIGYADDNSNSIFEVLLPILALH